MIVFPCVKSQLCIRHRAKVRFHFTQELNIIIRKFTPNVIAFDATEIAQELGAAVAQNVVILGALSAVPNFPLPEEELMKALKTTVKEKFIELNIKAFQKGQKKASDNIKES